MLCLLVRSYIQIPAPRILAKLVETVSLARMENFSVIVAKQDIEEKHVQSLIPLKHQITALQTRATTMVNVSMIQMESSFAIALEQSIAEKRVASGKIIVQS